MLPGVAVDHVDQLPDFSAGDLVAIEVVGVS